MTFVLLQLLQFKSTHCIFINTALRGSRDYLKTFVAHLISMGPQRHRYQPKNAGWHISFWRSLVLDHLLGLHQSCQDKAFAEPNFPWRIKNKQNPHHLAQNTPVSSFSFKYGFPHWKKGLEVLTSTELTQHCIFTLRIRENPRRTTKTFAIWSGLAL